MTSCEVTKFLRLLFETAADDTSAARISSHSLKATVLSWASKAGLSVYDRAVLGRHSSAYAEAQAIYARDLVISSVMKLQQDPSDSQGRVHSGQPQKGILSRGSK